LEQYVVPGSILVLILNWRRADDTIACLRSLFALQRNDLCPVVIDNGSDDGSEAAIRAAFPNVPLVQTGANLGYAGGNNVGLRLALNTSARYVMLLNNDTVLREDLFAPLLEVAAAANDSVVLGPKTYSLEDSSETQFAGVVFVKDELRFRSLLEQEAEEAWGKTLNRTAYIQGSALMIPMSVLRDVGLFDERFFLTYEEVDWCFRARAKGFECWVVPDSRVWHASSPSFGGRLSPLYDYFTTRNELLWIEKEIGLSVALRRFGKPLYWELRNRLRSGANADPASRAGIFGPANRAFLQGHLDYLTRRFGDCPKWVRLARRSSPSSTA
jgi:hypothetical protein